MEDLQLLADVLALKDDSPLEEVPLKEARVALMKTPVWPQGGPGTIATMEKAANILRSRGVKVEGVSFPPEYGDVDALKRMHSVVATVMHRRLFLGSTVWTRRNWLQRFVILLKIDATTPGKKGFKPQTSMPACVLFSTILQQSILPSLHQAWLTRHLSVWVTLAVPLSTGSGR